MSDLLLLRGGRIVDPAAGRDEIGDLAIRNGVIAEAPASVPAGTDVFDATGLVVTPGLIDLHVHLREPGGEDAETIQSGSRAAARGGFTSIVAMPNTKPPIDSPESVVHVRLRGESAGLARVIPSACLTVGRKGTDLANLAGMSAAGALAFTDDGSTVPSDTLMLAAMHWASVIDIVIMDHAQDKAAEASGVMHEGEFSRRHNLPGIPSSAESAVVERDIRLAEQSRCALHIQHVSAAESVALLRDARRRRLRVSGELTPHHLALTDADVRPDDANFKMNPPLRSGEDRRALIDGIVDGTLQAFATDHAPHSEAAKQKGFAQAPFGIVGLETAVGVTYTELVAKGLMDLPTWVSRWTTGPAQVLGLPEPCLEPGEPASVAVFDFESAWTVDPSAFVSRSRNTPFKGRTLKGQAVLTVLRGRTVWRRQGARPAGAR